jgi:mRNA-degrading endonuclease RelE of RelBE toxin-antitoxin system
VLAVFSILQNSLFEKRILSGLPTDKGRAAQISTAMRALVEIIASDVSLLVTFNHAIDCVINNNPKARANLKALAQLDGYKRLRLGLYRLIFRGSAWTSEQGGIAAGDHRPAKN